MAVLLLAGCTKPPPKVEGLEWSLERSADKASYSLHLSGQFEPQSRGQYEPSIDSVDERGCKQTAVLVPVNVGQSGATADVIKVDLTRRIATATLKIYFEPGDSGRSARQVFAGSKVIDPKVSPRTDIIDPCSPSPAEKRAKEQELRKVREEQRKRERQEKAGRARQTASYGGYGSAALREHGEVIATVLNLNGLLCARVVSVEPLRVSSDAFEVTCVEYRGGTGTVRYIVNAANGTAYRP